MNEVYKEWIKKAEEDLKVVEILLKESNYPPSIVCFHCQQSAEKYLKSFLVANNIEFPKTHDLEILIDAFCKPINKEFENLNEEAFLLTDFAITPRYPGDFYEATVSDAEQAYEAAIKIKEFVSANLK